MTDIEGTILTPDEQYMIEQPEIGGIILFARNFQNYKQLKTLTTNICSIKPNILIAVDQEGGRVQRFCGENFTKIPDMSLLGNLYQTNQQEATSIAFECGVVTGFELKRNCIDINFAPVLDIKRNNKMLNSRCFGENPETVIALTSHYIKGLSSVGIHAVGKHFPGHGGVTEDSHTSIPKDNRLLNDLQKDIQPFSFAIKQGIKCLMTSHVIYPNFCNKPASFSSYWISQVLRKDLLFNGVVFSDCLNMAATSIIGSFSERAEKALQAGCDMLLLCNNRTGTKETIQWLKQYKPPTDKLKRLTNLKMFKFTEMVYEKRRLALQEKLTAISS